MRHTAVSGGLSEKICVTTSPTIGGCRPATQFPARARVLVSSMSSVSPESPPCTVRKVGARRDRFYYAATTTGATSSLTMWRPDYETRAIIRVVERKASASASMQARIPRARVSRSRRKLTFHFYLACAHYLGHS